LISSLGGSHHRGEGAGIDHSELGKHFAVDPHIGFLEATDQAAVAHAIEASGGIDPGDPETTEIALATTTVAVGVAEGLHHPLIRGAEEGAVAAAETAGKAKDLVAALAGDVASFDASHGCGESWLKDDLNAIPICSIDEQTWDSGVGHHQGHTLFIGAVHHGLGGEVALQLRALVIEQVIAEGATTQELASGRRLEPLGGSFAGLELGHVSGCAWHKRQQYAFDCHPLDDPLARRCDAGMDCARPGGNT